MAALTYDFKDTIQSILHAQQDVVELVTKWQAMFATEAKDVTFTFSDGTQVVVGNIAKLVQQLQTGANTINQYSATSFYAGSSNGGATLSAGQLLMGGGDLANYRNIFNAFQDVWSINEASVTAGFFTLAPYAELSVSTTLAVVAPTADAGTLVHNLCTSTTFYNSSAGAVTLTIALPQGGNLSWSLPAASTVTLWFVSTENSLTVNVREA